VLDRGGDGGIQACALMLPNAGRFAEARASLAQSRTASTISGGHVLMVPYPVQARRPSEVLQSRTAWGQLVQAFEQADG
jgi:hypothetical protein